MNTPKYGITEELKNFNVSIKVAPCGASIQTNLLYAQKLEIQPKIEQLQNNALKITFFYNNIAILMIYVTFSQKNNNNSAFDAIKNNKINAGKIINSNVILNEGCQTMKNSSSSLNRDSISYSSVNHYFSFNKEMDQFIAYLSLETSLSKTTFSYSFFFGQFDNIHNFKNSSSEINESMNVKTEEKDQCMMKIMGSPAKNNETSNDQHIDDQQSTKSTSPLQEDLHHGYDNHLIINPIVPQFGLQSSELITRPTALTATTTTTTTHINDEQMKIEENEESHLQYTKLRQRRSSKNQQSANALNSHEESSCNESARNKKAKYDKKNVVKNFIKAFDGYFLDPHNDQQLMSLFDIKSKEQLKSLRQEYEVQQKKLKYNNKMIIAIIYSVFKDIFLHFLMYEADKWISHSSVFDKEAHRTILRDYIRAAENPRDIPKIVNLRIRNREPNSKYSI